MMRYALTIIKMTTGGVVTIYNGFSEEILFWERSFFFALVSTMQQIKQKVRTVVKTDALSSMMTMVMIDVDYLKCTKKNEKKECENSCVETTRLFIFAPFFLLCLSTP